MHLPRRLNLAISALIKIHGFFRSLGLALSASMKNMNYSFQRFFSGLPAIFLFLSVLAGSPAWAEEEFLPPEQAFPLVAEAEGPNQVVINWSVAEGYYLYRNKFRFRSLTAGIRPGEADIPPGESRHDEFFGEVKILRGAIEVWLPLERGPDSGERLDLEVSSQGCADAGFCYPPHRQTLAITLPPPVLVPGASAAKNASTAGESLTPPSASPTASPAAPPTASPATPTADPQDAPAPVPPSTSPSGGKAGVAQSLGLGLGLGASGDDQSLLPADEAFRLAVEPVAPDRLRLRWTIAPGTFLYRDKLALKLDGPTGATLGEVAWPAAERVANAVRPDGSLGDVHLYREGIEVEVPIAGLPADGQGQAQAVTLTASYQGCADIGVCYPPQRTRVELSMPALRSGPALASADQAGGARSDVALVGSGQADTVQAGVGQTGGPRANAGLAVTAQAGAARDLAARESTASPATTLAPPPAPSPEPPRSEQDQIAATLASGSLWATLGLFFGFGLLLALTPCVFPMIPILSGIIAGHGPGISTRKAFWMSLTYVLAMALTYAIAGLLAGLGGANLQAAFQDPLILAFFALVFVALALSMFGFYDLQLPSALQSRIASYSQRQQGGHLIGVAIMGALSALIVGPCVAPPLAGALIFISQTGDALLGFAALFALGLGMGAPLLAIGTSAGKLLPRAGVWMEAVKAVFGVTLLGVAILLLERILPPAVSLLLWGSLLICSAIYLGAITHLPPDASGWRKLWQGLGLVLLVYGALMLVGAAAGGKDTLQPLRGINLGLGAGGPGGAPQGVQFKAIKGTAGLERELAAARTSGRPVLLDFYADWCVSCKEMERYTFSDPTVAAEMARFVPLKADVTANDAEDQALMQGRFGIPGPPAMLFFDGQGQERRDRRIVGFMPAAEFAAHLRGLLP